MKQFINSNTSILLLLGSVTLLFLSQFITNTFYAYGLTVLLAALAFYRPTVGIAFLFIYFPYRSLMLEFNPSLKLIGDLIILAMALRVAWNSRKHITTLLRFELFEFAFLGFIAVGSISAFLTGVTTAAIVFQVRAFLIMFLLFYVVRRLNLTKKDYLFFGYVIILSLTPIVIQGYVEKLSLRSAFMPEAWINKALSNTNKVRVYGVLNNPNTLAMYLICSGIVTALVRHFTSHKWIRNLLSFILLVTAGLFILTFSRGSFIFLAILIVLFSLLQKNFKMILKTGIGFVLAFALFAFPTIQLASWIESNTQVGSFERTDTSELRPLETDRLKETFSSDTLALSSNSGRLYIVKTGFEIFRDYPIIGSGFGTFGDSATKSYQSPIYKDYGIYLPIYSDNQYIQIIAQTGVLGVLLFAVFLLAMSYRVFRFSSTSMYVHLAIASIIGVMAVGLLYNIWENKTFTLFFFVFLGILFNFYKPITTNKPTKAL
ncbi:O-antigen ligase family protein [Chryseomicrobium palamuruense]